MSHLIHSLYFTETKPLCGFMAWRRIVSRVNVEPGPEEMETRLIVGGRLLGHPPGTGRGATRSTRFWAERASLRGLRRVPF